jgi:uncharacterized phage-associated protein
MVEISRLVGFRSRKAAQASTLFLNKSSGRIDKLKLIKLLYMCERDSIRIRGRPIFYDEFYSLEHGPICSNALDAINGKLDVSIWSEYLAKKTDRDIYIVPKVNEYDLDELSTSDIDIITAVWGRLGGMTAREIRNWTHQNCPEYREIESGRLPIQLDDISAAIWGGESAHLALSVSEYRSLEASIIKIDK